MISFFRIVATDPATLEDFMSNQARGKQPRVPAEAEVLRLWSGLSVYATEAQARRKARSAPYLGGFIAELVVPEVGDIRFERTLLGSPGHHTLWGAPDPLLAAVVRIVRVEQEN